MQGLQARLASLKDKFSLITPPSAAQPRQVSSSSSSPTPSSTPSAPSVSSSVVRPKVKLESVQIPDFGGNILEYPQFKATFQALTGGQGLMDEAIQIYLKKAIPKDVQHLLLGAKDMSVVWARLDDRFGNLHLRSLAIYEKLARLELRGKDYERVERLHQEVEWAHALLEDTGNLDAVQKDMFIVNVLVQKLSAAWQEKWMEHCEGQEAEVLPGNNE